MKQSTINKIQQLTQEEKQLLKLKIKDLVNNGTLKTNKNHPKKLVAFVRKSEVESVENLKIFLKKSLPNYMVPNKIHAISEFPFLPNGKVDRKKVLELKTTLNGTVHSRNTSDKDLNDTEQKLIAIWEDVLGFSPIKVNDNFFEIGGDSILSIQIVSKAKKEGIQLKANQLFEYQTISELVSYTKAQETENALVDNPNELENKLITIWEDVLGFSPIRVDDNFFEIGGDSILSIQIVSKARKAGIQLNANQLFQSQTVRELATLIFERQHIAKKWDFVTSIRKEGSKNPLFCIHSGGGHVFFYGLLRDYIKEDRPIYAIEPLGLNDETEMHKDIESMSKTYLEAIKDIQPQGTLNILVNCFSTAVGNEICILMQNSKDKVNLIVADTMASPWNAIDKESLSARRKYFIKRFLRNPIKAVGMFISDRKYLVEPYIVKYFGKDFEKDLERIKANLRKLSLDYIWKAHNGYVSLILTEKIDERFQNHVIKSWEKLAKGGVKTYFTKGHHNTLFTEPDIESLSKQIDAIIQD